jgi:hypothetical protein
MSQVISTGFLKLDTLLPLTPGLHLIGARPNTGATELLLQMAYNIAKADTPVIFVDLEHRAKELYATLISQRANLLPNTQKVTPVEIMNGSTVKSAIAKQVYQLVQEKKRLMILHPSKRISYQQLIKLLEEYHTKCETPPVIIINPLNALIDADQKETLTQALQAISEWQMQHSHIPILTRCHLNDFFQRHIQVSSFGFGRDITDSVHSITGIQLRVLCTKEFYGTRDEDGDFHSTSLRAQLQTVQNTACAKIRHLRVESMKGLHVGETVDLDYDTTYLSVNEL